MSDLTSKLSKYQREAFAKADKDPTVRKTATKKVAKDSASPMFSFEYVRHESLTQDSLEMALQNQNTTTEKLYKLRRKIPIEALNAKDREGRTAAQLLFQYGRDIDGDNIVAEFIEQLETRIDNLSHDKKAELLNSMKDLIFKAVEFNTISTPEVESAFSKHLLQEHDIRECAKQGMLTDSLLNAKMEGDVKVYKKLMDSNITIEGEKYTTIEKWIEKKHPNIALIHKLSKELDSINTEKIPEKELIKSINTVAQDTIQKVLYNRILEGDQAQYTHLMSKLFTEYHSAIKRGDFEKAAAISAVQEKCIEAVRINKGHFTAEELDNKQELLETTLESSGEEHRDPKLEEAKDIVWQAVFERAGRNKGIDDKTLLNSIVLLPCKEVETNFKTLKSVLNHKSEYYTKHFKSEQNKSNKQVTDTKKESSQEQQVQTNKLKKSQMDIVKAEVQNAVNHSTGWTKATVSSEAKMKRNEKKAMTERTKRNFDASKEGRSR